MIQHLWKQARNRQARLLDSSGHILNEVTLPASMDISEGSEGLTVFEGWLVNVEAGSPRAAHDNGPSVQQLPGRKRARQSVPVLRQRFAVPRQEAPLLVPAVSQHDRPQQHGLGRAEAALKAPLLSAQASAGPADSTAWPRTDAGQAHVNACRPQLSLLAIRPVGDLEPAAEPLPVWQPQAAALHQSCGSSAVLESGCRARCTAAGAASALHTGDTSLNHTLAPFPVICKVKSERGRPQGGFWLAGLHMQSGLAAGRSLWGCDNECPLPADQEILQMLASLGPGAVAAQHASQTQIPCRSASSARQRPGDCLASAVHRTLPQSAAAAGQLLSPGAVHDGSAQLSGAAKVSSPSRVSPLLQLLVAGVLSSPGAAHCTPSQLAGAAGDMVGLSPAVARALPWQEVETKAACVLASPESDARVPHATAAALPSSAAGVEQPAMPAWLPRLGPACQKKTAVAAAAGGGMQGQAAAAACVGDGMQSQAAAAAASRERMRSLAMPPSATATSIQALPVAHLDADALASAALRWGQPASAQPADRDSVGTATLQAALCPLAATGAPAAADSLRQPRFKVPAGAWQHPPEPGSAVGPRQAPGGGDLHLRQQQSVCFPSAAHAALPAARWTVIADSYATVQEYKAAMQASLVEELNLR